MVIMASKNGGFTIEEIREEIRKNFDKIDDVKLFYELKKQKFIRGRKELRSIKTVMSLAKMGLPITSETYAWAAGISAASALSNLHSMGDKKMLVWERTCGMNIETKPGGPYRWILSPILANLIAFVWRG